MPLCAFTPQNILDEELMAIQKIQDCNWEEILNIQEEAYQQIGSEELNILKNKQEYSPSTCLVSVSKTNEVQGYLLAHPWLGKEPPKLFQALPRIYEYDCLYLHDMAVSSRFRGLGVGTNLISHLFSIAKHRQMKRIALVAVQGSSSFWANNGFEVVTGIIVDASYGNGAVLMEIVLP